jgi:small conductance mechanosensitive channel
MPAMLELPALPVPLTVTLQLVLIIVAALVAFLVLRAAVGIGTRHLIERQGEDAGAGALPPEELERRINTVGRLLVRIAGSIIVIIAVLMGLRLFGIDIGPAVAGLGVVGIAVGLGAQALIRDWLTGVFIVLENQFSAGDVIRVAGVEGVVEDFSLRRTTLRDLDGTLHTVPNGQILVASNMTRMWARVHLDINVAADTDLDRSSDLIDRVGVDLQADPEWGPRLLEPPRVVRVEADSDASVRLKVLGQVRAAEQWAVGAELRRRLLAAFAQAGIDVPFPERVVVARGPETDGTDPETARTVPPG